MYKTEMRICFCPLVTIYKGPYETNRHFKNESSKIII